MFKAGDRVYRAMLRVEGIEMGEATVARVGPKEVVLDSNNHRAWRFRARVPPSECHPSREAALRALLDEVRRNERDCRESMEAEQKRAAEIEAMLRTPAESASP